MLTELETLSQNIGRLIAINERHQQARHALEEQLAQLRADNDSARAELELLRDERNALQVERDTLLAKIDDAQVRLNAILEKLPRTKGPYEGDNQLDLLAEPGEHAAPHGNAAANSTNSAAERGENA